MQSSHVFYKRSRRGKVLKVLREHYLRDDISSCSAFDPLCAADDNETGQDPVEEGVLLSANPYKQRYLLLDTNTVLHQIDVLEHDCPPVSDVIIVQTVLEETKHRNLALYNRLRDVIRNRKRRFVVFPNMHHRDTYAQRNPQESSNDYNDRLIRIAAAWYQQHLGDKVSIVLVTNDVDNLTKAKQEGLNAMTMKELAEQEKDSYPELLEHCAAPMGEQDTQHQPTQKEIRQTGRRKWYDEHLPLSTIQTGIKQGKYRQGTLRNSRDCWFDATVSINTSSNEQVPVLIRGRTNMNRAMDGDAVAIQILPKSEWRQPSDRLAPAPSTSMEEEKQEEELELNNETSKHLDGSSSISVGESELKNASSQGMRPTGKVVGIIRRNWRQYCGSLEPDSATSRGSGGNVVGGATWALFVPVDAKFPRIRIETRQREELLDKRIVVAIDSWDVYSKYPRGHYVKTLGKIGDKEVETQVVLLEHEIPTGEFSAAVMACLPPADWQITHENSKGREDFRGLRVCSIDPPGCKDIDDALHTR